MAAIFAEWQRERISSSTKAAQERLRRQGKFPNHPPFGFDLVDGSLVPVVSELETMALMIELKNEGMTPTGIAKKLNDAGIRSKKGGTWSHKTVADQFENLDKYPDLYKVLKDLE